MALKQEYDNSNPMMVADSFIDFNLGPSLPGFDSSFPLGGHGQGEQGQNSMSQGLAPQDSPISDARDPAPMAQEEPTKQTGRKSRRMKTPKQVNLLKTAFANNRNPNRDVMMSYAEATGLTYKEVSRWFRNQRHKEKKEQSAYLAQNGGKKERAPIDNAAVAQQQAPLKKSRPKSYVNNREVSEQIAEALSTPVMIRETWLQKFLTTSFRPTSYTPTELIDDFVRSMSPGDKQLMFERIILERFKDYKHDPQYNPEDEFRPAADPRVTQELHEKRSRDAWEKLERSFGVLKCIEMRKDVILRQERVQTRIAQLESLHRPRTAEEELELREQRELLRKIDIFNSCRKKSDRMESELGSADTLDNARYYLRLVSGLATPDESQLALSLDPNMMEGLVHMFQPHRDYLYAISKALGVTEMLRAEMILKEERKRLAAKNAAEKKRTLAATKEVAPGLRSTSNPTPLPMSVVPTRQTVPSNRAPAYPTSDFIPNPSTSAVSAVLSQMTPSLPQMSSDLAPLSMSSGLSPLSMTTSLPPMSSSTLSGFAGLDEFPGLSGELGLSEPFPMDGLDFDYSSSLFDGPQAM